MRAQIAPAVDPLDASPASRTVSVVVPCHVDGPDLRACLAAIANLDPAPDELVVAVDGADPDLLALAGRHAEVVVPVVPRGGPAVARNLGACHASGDVLWFVDADVEVHADGVARVRDLLADPTVAGVVGSYDDRPPAPGVVARYKNLLNHHVHQHAGRDVATFWGACGAVRRAAFLAVGGFDGVTYPHPSIEDIELGHRLADAGHRVVLDPSLQVTHRKAWTLATLVDTDVRRRALPWAELLLDRGVGRAGLNVDAAGRVKVAATCLAACLLLVSPPAGARRTRAIGVAGLLGLVAGLDAPLIRTFARAPVGGSGFAVVAWALQLLSYLYSGAAAGAAAVRHVTGRSTTPTRPPAPLVPVHPVGHR